MPVSLRAPSTLVFCLLVGPLLAGCGRQIAAEQLAAGPQRGNAVAKPAEAGKPKAEAKTQVVRALIATLDEIAKDEQFKDKDKDIDEMKRSLLRADKELSKVLGRRNLQRMIAIANQQPVRGADGRIETGRRADRPVAPPKAAPGEAAKSGTAQPAELAPLPVSPTVRALLETLDKSTEPPQVKQALRKAILTADRQLSQAPGGKGAP